MPSTEAERLARLFHETYERLAPEHGYETRRESAVPWEQVPANNRALMTEVCEHILATRQLREPRVWFDGDVVPPGVWVYAVDETDPDHQLTLLDADEPCENINLGPLVEAVRPDDIDAIVNCAQEARRG